MEKTKEISRKEIIGLKITRCIGMISFHLGTWMCIFNFLIGNTYNFASDTIKVLDRTSFALVETGLCAFLISLLFEICLNRKGIHLGEREREPMKKINNILENLFLVYLGVLATLGTIAWL